MNASRALSFLLLFLSSTLVYGMVLPTDAEVQKKLGEKLQGKDDYNERTVRRVGNRTIEVEGLISMEGDIALTKEILAEPKEFGRWLLPKINQRPSGGEYFVKVLGLSLAPESNDVLITNLRFDLPLFKKDINCYMKVDSQSRGGKGLVFNATVDSMQGTYIEHFHTVLQFFQREKGRLWVYAKGEVRFKHWILYEALPDRMLNRETGERLQIAIDNYLNEENHRRSRKVKVEVENKKGGSLKVSPHGSAVRGPR